MSESKRTEGPMEGECNEDDRMPRTPTFGRFTKAERAAVEKIVVRAYAMFSRYEIHHPKNAIRMDIAAVHGRYPLRLEELADADDMNFAHDIGGIYKHLDRITGDLRDCFLPRYTDYKARSALAKVKP